MNNNSSHFSSEDFLEDAEYEMKRQYGSVQAFAKEIGCHRNTIGNVLNHPEKLKFFWIRVLSRELGLDLRYYRFD